MKTLIAIATGYALCACGGDSFQFILNEGGSDASSEAAMEMDTGQQSDSDPADSSNTPDSPVDSNSSDANSCNQTGTQACISVIDAYCTRLAQCCNQQCSYAWANQGGMACRNYWESNVSQMDCTKYGQKQVCTEGACLTDIGNVSCAAIICNNQMPCPPLPKPMQITNACSTFWGGL